jgi:hypothetical protein
MNVAVRPRATAGLALAGAAVIAVSPIAPTLPNVHVPDIHLPSLHQTQVELTALTDPLQAWVQVVTAALGNVVAVGGEVAADPAPILQKIIQDQLANGVVVGAAAQATIGALTDLVNGLPAILQTAGQQAAAGDLPGAFQGIIVAALPSLLNVLEDVTDGFQAVVNTAQNVTNVVAAIPNLLLPTVLAFAGPVISVGNFALTTTQDVINAVGTGDLEGIANALLNAPSGLVGAALNGFGNGPLGVPSPGLLSPQGIAGAFTAGTISGLLALRDVIAAALKPLPPPTTPAPAASLQAKLQSGTPVGELPAGSGTHSVTVSVPEATSSTDTGKGDTTPTTSDEKGATSGESASNGETATPSDTDGTADSTTGKTDTDTTKGDAIDPAKDGSDASGKTDESASDTGDSTGKPGKPDHQESTGSSAGDDATGSKDTTGSKDGSSDTGSATKSTANSSHKSNGSEHKSESKSDSK